ncbi:MAG: tRNA glutamyl-Q(34) synthetase GluQRS [Pirellulales bacterium]|nr:tRNA glutamyl-Q(34) synthetase GluQRS [Pirellulales bacterium]
MAAGRLAPSPTGAQHLGNARTYLLAYWSARAAGSNLVLRIEDIDSPRIKPWATQQAIDDLRWLGVSWDEGPDIGGPHAPYIQTERVELYQQTLQRLVAADRAYPCTCTRKDIQAAGSAPHFEHEGPIYPGTCAGWQNGDPLPAAGSYCWRFRTGENSLVFDDLLIGQQQCVPALQLGDFPITQKSGRPSYQLAVVVDDAEMEVTEVVRGDDLIASTFRQIELYLALELPPPKFAHVPLVCGTDGRRLAKRHGDTRLSQFRAEGIGAEKIVGWAAHSAGLIDTPAPLAAEELIPRFDWQRVCRDCVEVHRDVLTQST